MRKTSLWKTVYQQPKIRVCNPGLRMLSKTMLYLRNWFDFLNGVSGINPVTPDFQLPFCTYINEGQKTQHNLLNASQIIELLNYWTAV